MQLHSLDHVHFSVPDLARAEAVYGPFLGGEFTPVYGGPDLNAYGSWNSHGGDFIQVIEAGAPVFGEAPILKQGLMSVSFRVDDVDVGIEQAEAAGLRLLSRVGSEDVGFGKNVIQAQFAADESHGLGVELVERQIPGDPYRPMTETAVDHIEHYVPDLEAPAAFFTDLLGSPFDDAFDDDELGARSVRHPRFGVQLTAPTRGDGELARRLDGFGGGPHAIAFRSRDLAADSATAEKSGLKVARRAEAGPGATAVELEREAGVVVKLVERAG